MANILDAFRSLGKGEARGKRRPQAVWGGNPNETGNPYHGRKRARLKTVRKTKRAALKKQRRLARVRA